ncbi:hypothetical protein D9758_011707 [Tetrapyrgos nigripes]|uniref:Transmembrane protein n=1 Tax=Tetrapyrgos nigripes TaxID=182062 RepID=A0A8H5GDE4_9AGAR|nr:hypothetical protein D9758_011707 [Tetrapyrgos nigripes]
MLVTVEECSPLIHYEPAGYWEEGREFGNESYSGGSYMLSWHPSSTASFAFNGTGFSIFGVQGPSLGNFVVSVDGVNNTGTANLPELKYQAVLFEARELDDGPHNVVFSIADGNRPVKIDFITWTSNMDLGNDDGNPPVDGDEEQVKFFQDSDEHFTYSPRDAWNTDPERVQGFKNQSGHSTTHPDASMMFTFNGTAISLCGSVGPAQTSSYSVSLDSMAPVWFNATRTWWAKDQVLYHASNLGHGEHTIVVTNAHQGTATPRSPPDLNSNPLVPRTWSRRQVKLKNIGEEGPILGLYGRGLRRQAVPSDAQGILGAFDLDYAKVWGADLAAVTSTSASPTLTPSSAGTTLSTGAIAGISVASVVFLSLLGALWFLNKRNNILWRHLQKGYMVQSQYDASGSPRSTSPGQNMSSVSLLHNQPIRRGTGDIDPFPPGYDAATRHPGANRPGLYVPYAGFGHQKSSSKSSSPLESSEESLPTKEGYQTYYDNAPTTLRPTEPIRSDTMLTSSTLVAEDGTFATLDDIAEGPKSPVKPVKRSLRRVGPPTNSTITTPTTPTPSMRISGPGNSTRSSRRRNKAYLSSQRSKASRRTHSSSPSRDQLLGPGNHFNSDSDLNEWEYEDDISDEWEEAQEFYASEASLAGILAGTPVSYGRRRLSLDARTQSELEVQTPIGRNFDYRDAPVPEVPLVRHGSSVAGMGTMDVTGGSEGRSYQPRHQGTDDTMSTLPAYTSKRNSLL